MLLEEEEDLNTFSFLSILRELIVHILVISCNKTYALVNHNHIWIYIYKKHIFKISFNSIFRPFVDDMTKEDPSEPERAPIYLGKRRFGAGPSRFQCTFCLFHPSKVSISIPLLYLFM